MPKLSAALGGKLVKLSAATGGKLPKLSAATGGKLLKLMAQASNLAFRCIELEAILVDKPLHRLF